MSQTNADLKSALVKEVQAAARHRMASDVFADVVRAMALALESPFTLGKRHEDIEREYAAIRDKYEPGEFEHFPRALALTSRALEKAREDFLGPALEELNATNRNNGQFFTPADVSRAMARMLLPDALKNYKPGTPISLSDPACGSSVLLIEGAEELTRLGVRQADIVIHAGDIDGRACDISYVQLSLLGYAACVQHMNALSQRRHSPDRFTPGWYLHGMPMRWIRGGSLVRCAGAEDAEKPREAAAEPRQMELFDV